MSFARSSSVIGPSWLPGGTMKARSTMQGLPFSSSSDTSASPTPSSVITFSAFSFGLGRSVSAAVFTAFWSRGVNARSACCTRLPSWPSTMSGTSSGFCVTKNTPTPFERMSRTTCSILSSRTHAAPAIGLQEVVDVEHRLADELVAALLLEREQAALDRADRRRRDVAVAGLERLRVVARVLQQRAQVLEVEEQEAVVVRDLEDEREHARLRVVEVQDAREQQGTEVGDRRAHRMALLAEHVE